MQSDSFTIHNHVFIHNSVLQKYGKIKEETNFNYGKNILIPQWFIDLKNKGLHGISQSIIPALLWKKGERVWNEAYR